MLHLYGDESAYRSVVTYALLCVDAERQSAVERALADVKEMFGGPRDARLHCRELFNGHARAKTPWAHLRREEPMQLLVVTANYLRNAGAHFRLGCVNAADFVGQAAFTVLGQATPTGPKQLAAFARLCSLLGLDVEPGLANLRMWADPETTRTPWGGKKLQAGLIPVTFDGGQAVATEPVGDPKPVLLDVADMLAYCAAHALYGEDAAVSSAHRAAYEAFAVKPTAFNFAPQLFPLAAA